MKNSMRLARAGRSPWVPNSRLARTRTGGKPRLDVNRVDSQTTDVILHNTCKGRGGRVQQRSTKRSLRLRAPELSTPAPRRVQLDHLPDALGADKLRRYHSRLAVPRADDKRPQSSQSSLSNGPSIVESASQPSLPTPRELLQDVRNTVEQLNLDSEFDDDTYWSDNEIEQAGRPGGTAAGTVGRAVYEAKTVDASGKTRRIYVKRRDLLRTHALAPRDLRRMDNLAQNAQVLSAKGNCILIKTCGVRVIVTAESAFVLEPDSPMSSRFLRITIPRLKARAGACVLAEYQQNRNRDARNVGSPDTLPFELEVVEAALMLATSRLDAELLSVTRRMQSVLQKLPNDVNPVNLEELRRVKQALNVLEGRTSSLKVMLEEIMDDEDELRELNLSSRPPREERRKQRERERLEREVERELETRMAEKEQLAQLQQQLAWEAASSSNAGGGDPAPHAATGSSSVCSSSGGGGGGGGASSWRAYLPPNTRPQRPSSVQYRQRQPSEADGPQGAAPDRAGGTLEGWEGGAAQPHAGGVAAAAGTAPGRSAARPQGLAAELAAAGPGSLPHPTSYLAPSPYTHLRSLDETHADGEVLDAAEQLEEMDEQEEEQRDLEEVEDLLEYYLQRAAATQNEADRLLQGARDLEESIGVSLSAKRFEVNRLELTLSIGSFAAALGALISGIFGMNLQSTLETSIMGFWGVSLAIVALCVWVFRTILLWTQKRRIL